MLGRKDRRARLESYRQGSWGTASQDYVRLCELLYEQSAQYARRHDGNVSPYSLAGIPALFSALRALLIEAHSGLFDDPYQEDCVVLRKLANKDNELDLLSDGYGLGTDTLRDFRVLYEIRNEIVHPAHRPAGTPHNTPLDFEHLRLLGVLQSTGHDAGPDYGWYAQLQSHKLFRWAFTLIEVAASQIIRRHHNDSDRAQLHLSSYSRFRAFDA